MKFAPLMVSEKPLWPACTATVLRLLVVGAGFAWVPGGIYVSAVA
jgi:hypothetical protein